MKYQLVVLGPNADRYDDILGEALTVQITALNLDPERDFEVLDETRGSDIEWKGNPTGVWFGGSDRTPSTVLATLLNRGVPVLPLVEDLSAFSELVPDPLLPINGRQWNDERVPADVLRCFRLTRELRQAFISYRRVDSKGVANGLFDALTHLGYHVFLDTASVEATSRFQDVLWDRMADMDLLVLLDSPNALTSRWVNDELTRVNQLGLGVLQLVWPEHEPFVGTELSIRRQLGFDDFEGGRDGPRQTLTASALKEITRKAEEVRIRSLGARRVRVVNELMIRASQAEFQAFVHPFGPVKLLKSDARPGDPLVGLALPVVGLPDAWSIHQAEKALRKLRDSAEDNWKELVTLDQLLADDGVRIIYDGLGIQEDRRDHLIWLNEWLKLRTAKFDRAANESIDSLGEWLTTLKG